MTGKQFLRVAISVFLVLWYLTAEAQESELAADAEKKEIDVVRELLSRFDDIDARVEALERKYAEIRANYALIKEGSRRDEVPEGSIFRELLGALGMSPTASFWFYVASSGSILYVVVWELGTWIRNLRMSAIPEREYLDYRIGIEHKQLILWFLIAIALAATYIVVAKYLEGVYLPNYWVTEFVAVPLALVAAATIFAFGKALARLLLLVLASLRAARAEGSASGQ